jgi:hypothetical protein
MSTLDSHDQDFYAWAMKSAESLRQGRIADLDIEHLAEEIEDMGRGIKRALAHRLTVLLAHLLKWEFQPEFRSRSWRYTIIEQRDAITDLLEESPSLKHGLEEVASKAYQRAVRDAADETELKTTVFPAQCPWSLERALDAEYWPG